MYYPIIRKVLFQLNLKCAHALNVQQLRGITGTPLVFLVCQSMPTKPISCMGLSFKNSLGLAASPDKNGECIDAFGAMGFGYVKIGTVTPRPQPGNDKPSLFRVVQAAGLIKPYGF